MNMTKIENFTINLSALSNGFVVVIEGYGSTHRLPTTKAFADSLETAQNLIADTLGSADTNALDLRDEQAKYGLAAAQGQLMSSQAINRVKGH
jgi:hypothetical protein